MSYKGPDRRKENYFFIAQLMDQINGELDRRFAHFQTELDVIKSDIKKLEAGVIGFEVYKAKNSSVYTIATIVSAAVAGIVAWLVKTLA